MVNKDIVWHEASITKKEYHEKNGHKSGIIWLTGLSGSGKSTIANAAARQLFEEGFQVTVLDGDNVRHGLNKDLGFSDEDRKENIRRIGEVAKLFVEQGTIVITAFISPFKEDRDLVRQLVGENEFHEVYVKCDLETCEKRDPKGLYKKARNGEIPFFTGIDSPYEEPESPELILNTSEHERNECKDRLVEYVKNETK
ncbi:adenylylsulfate kinase [Bacillus glycinifermentans]|uniref:Adenylyl-sulfate kinase n=1 Tax=Bacillus glycinifermentans TaxID=1664069 RepID=A0A0J6EKB5_9BACI|nr:adenylyl-sulfate kinase [Bacillus glycinifermentans]ATH91362.1 adenylyl-sulfate kinase [Bacillus glycinifermentans]KMM57089.1 adenylylsulfate kinase [Bacillus glycinifermentans]KRT93358.1 adenylyl-sulfate kinase [Bacillus glycinifermentans]MEC0485326.1 adenylyl-sulfate kinase [Bacillus glycinifermentans]MEC0495488.1 adenylyl-sulfate kinase [Bacillus glycinifermentans]